jgi:Asp-tRNAAsn/Glu-tRNAGln amidotransferase A subunit and related amidases
LLYRTRMGQLCDGIGPEVNVDVIFASFDPGDFSAMSDELCLLPATELRARIVRKDVSPVEITRAVLRVPSECSPN